MTDSHDLLAEYRRNGSDTAFRELVTRYVDLVHSTALRLVEGDTHRAEDVTQTVFADLARLARTLSPEVRLGGWLHRHACYVAANTLRGERRRQARERQAVEMNTLQNHSETDFSEVAPLLDEAINELGEADRTAILLRFFEQQDFRTVGQALGSNEDAARMRVTRALEKLEEFLKRRDVTTSAASLGVALTTNAVQAAPVGLAVTISTAAALAGTTLATTATATATKAIVMTSIQKIAIVATVAVLAGAGIYEAGQASRLRDRIQTFQQQQAPLSEQIQQLIRERDEATQRLVSLREDNERLNRNNAEVLRLRGEVSRLRADSAGLANLKADVSNTPTESTAQTWVSRVARLKQRLEQVPEARIPELQLLNEEDWLAAVKGHTLDTDLDYRRALSTLRGVSESKLASLIQKSLKGFMRGNNGQFPTELAQLQPYFDVPVDPAILDRWEIAPAKAVPSVGVGDVIITQKAPVDDVFDTRLIISSDGQGSTDFLQQQTWETMKPVFEAYRAAHNDQWQADFSELQPYAKTPEQQAALQKLMLRNSGSK